MYLTTKELQEMLGKAWSGGWRHGAVHPLDREWREARNLLVAKILKGAKKAKEADNA